MTRKKVQTKDTLAYRQKGKGKTIVFLHGFCEDLKIWDELAEYLEDDFRTIAIDLPGFGDSTAVSASSIDEMAEHVIKLLSALKVHQYFLIGHSMGGYVSLAIAEKSPRSLMGLGLVHSHPFADNDEKKKNREKSIAFIKRNGHIHYVKQLIPSLFGPAFIRVNNYIISKLILRASRIQEQAIINALTAMKNRPDHSDTLAKIECPVLFIVGELDNTIPVDISRKQLTIPKISQAEILPDVGHMALFEVPRQTRVIIRKFLKYCLELK